MKVPEKLKKALFLKKNKIFLRRLFNLAQGTDKRIRLKAINKGNQGQRKVLIHVLFYVISGEIPLREADFPLISRNMTFLNRHFQTEEAMKSLLKSSAATQKEILGQVSNYRVLLYSLFKQ
jgi:hypothetical protein